MLKLVNLEEYGERNVTEMSGGQINITELMAALINQKESILEGLQYIHEVVKGTMSVLVMTKEGIYCSRDKYGRLPVIIGEKEEYFSPLSEWNKGRERNYTGFILS